MIQDAHNVVQRVMPLPAAVIGLPPAVGGAPLTRGFVRPVHWRRPQLHQAVGEGPLGESSRMVGLALVAVVSGDAVRVGDCVCDILQQAR